MIEARKKFAAAGRGGVSLLLCAVALAVMFIPGASEALQYDRAAIASGEIYRVLSGHFTHWTIEHLVWDVVVFAVLGVMVERRNLGMFLATVIGSSLAISIAVWRWIPEMHWYRGLSGVDSALFVVVCAELIINAARRSAWNWIVALLAVAGLLSKIIYEFQAGQAVFVQSGFEPVPIAHAVGASLGIFLSIIHYMYNVGTKHVTSLVRGACAIS